MIIRCTLLAVVAAAQLLAPSIVSARTNLTRREIRQMPIMERPSRPGHFYGNTVRRNAGRSIQPVAAVEQ
jgi:hypothetical protein